MRDATTQSRRRPNQRPWLLRSDLRLAVVTGLAAGFGLLSPIPYGYYLPMTTATVLSSSYGNALKLGVQRLLGSLMGVLLLIIFSKSLALPLALAIGMALGSTRLLGGMLGLEVGYKVAGNIIVMGWLVHSATETTWGPLRLVWTALGIALSLWASRWIWPSQAIPDLHRQQGRLMQAIAEELSEEASRLNQEGPGSNRSPRRETQRNHLLHQLAAIRLKRQDALLELGLNPEQQPLYLLWGQIDWMCSQTVSVVSGMACLPIPIHGPEPLRQLHHREAEVLQLMEQLLTMLVRDLSTLTQTGHTAFKAACLHKTVTALHQKGEQLNQQLTSTCKALDGDLPSSRLRQLIVRSTLIEQLVVISEGIATMTNASSNASRRKLQQTTSTPNR